MSRPPFPLEETPLTLPSGRVVAVLNLVAVAQRGRAGGTLGVQYRSAVPAADREGRRAEAAEVAARYAAVAAARGCRRLAAQLCNSPEAAALRALPELVLTFEPAADGTWRLTDEAEPPPRPAI